ncbi:MAG: hypothetical protein K6B52_03595 [Clostridiales bacterium]|nr:hypothetical protein [Clostridiales bacterium]
MISDILDEITFCEKIASMSYFFTPKDVLNFINSARYEHTQSACDENGDITTLLKSHIDLDGREIVFYKVMKTLTGNPDCESFETGYIFVT